VDVDCAACGFDEGVGAVVGCMQGKEGRVHISEWGESRVEKMAKVTKVGEEVWVKCIGIDDKGRCKLSRKAALKERSEAAQAGEGEATPEEAPAQA